MEQLDDKVRDAVRALDVGVPARYFDELPGRIAARLEEVDMQTDIEGNDGRDSRDGDDLAPAMMAADAAGIDPGASDAGVAGLASPSSSPSPSPNPSPNPSSDHSGLHDIKALAQTTRQRIKRISTQHEVDETLLSSSSSGLRMVALPEPARMVSLAMPGPTGPAIAELPVERAAKGSVAIAVPRAAAEAPTAATARRKPAVWIAAAVGLAAAAAIGIFVVGGGSKGDGAAPARTDVVATATTQPAPPPVVEPAAAVEVAAPVAAVTADTGGAPTGNLAAGDGTAVAVATPTREERAKAREDADRTGGRDAVVAEAKPVAAPKGDKAKPASPEAKPAAAPAASDASKSIDDLLDQASGGLGGSAGGKATTPADKPAKTELSRDDIKKGMGGTQGDAQGCYGKFGVAGTVKIKAVVAPSGAVSRAEATGEFAGTPTGACVAAAVKGASFPSWEGAPMTINYSFLLSE